MVLSLVYAYTLRYHINVKPLGKVKLVWSPELAYAVGLITTDGNLSKDGRHLSFTSKDEQLIELFKHCLNITNKVGLKASGSTEEKKYFTVQFGDINFYRFLIKLGLFPNKTHTLGSLKIPGPYFFDFLRGHFDGDGTFYSYWDPRWKSSFMFYLVFLSASETHILWLQNKLFKKLGVKGHINYSRGVGCLQLKYAKKESLLILGKLYPSAHTFCLNRKRLKIRQALGIIGKQI